MPSVDSAGASSGITTTSTGDRHIPASVRADGSTRKEIKIRPGYKPPEDVEVYKNRTAEGWKNRGSGGIPGAASITLEEETRSSNTKNAKRREARRKAKATEEGVQDDAAQDTVAAKQTPTAATAKTSTKGEDGSRKDEAAKAASQDLDPEAEKEKQVRNLRKKLRQAKELRAKRDEGQNLLPEQFEKVIKMNELIRQLDNLGFDANGEPK